MNVEKLKSMNICKLYQLWSRKDKNTCIIIITPDY